MIIVAPPGSWCRAVSSKISIFAGMLVFSSVIAASASPSPLPARLVISPPNAKELRELFERPDQWSHVRAKTGAILFADHSLNDFSNRELRAWFAAMRVWRLGLELEVGALKEWGKTADSTFGVERPIWDRMIALGADLQSVVMDEPLIASRASLHEPDGYALDQTARFVMMLRARYPSVLIGDVEPYPSVSATDHLVWLRGLQRRLLALGVRPLDFYRLDVDWIAFTNSPGLRGWPQVVSLSSEVRRLGVPFSLIYWASGYPSEKSQGLTGEDTWYVEIMSQGYAFAGLGAHPDQFVLESWVGAPDKGLPESDRFTFTGSALAFEQKFISRLDH